MRPQRRAARPPATGPAAEGRPTSSTALIALADRGSQRSSTSPTEVKPKLRHGMTGFDSTWYHGPFAAGSPRAATRGACTSSRRSSWPGSTRRTRSLPRGRDARLRPGPALAAAQPRLVRRLPGRRWCIGRPYRVAPWSLASGRCAERAGAVATRRARRATTSSGSSSCLPRSRSPSTPASAARTSRQELRSTRGPWSVCRPRRRARGRDEAQLPAARRGPGRRPGGRSRRAGRRWRCVRRRAAWPPWRAAATGTCATSSTPATRCPGSRSLGPISLPAPDQALGGREEHSVLGYLADGSVWSDWFLPGLHDGLGVLWPLVARSAACRRLRPLPRPRCASPVLRVAGAGRPGRRLGLADRPTSASGPEGMPRGFESGLRYLAPPWSSASRCSRWPRCLRGRSSARWPRSPFVHLMARTSGVLGPCGDAAGSLALRSPSVASAIGYPVQRDYLREPLREPHLHHPGPQRRLQVGPRDLEDARIATTSTRQYPLFGTDLSNRRPVHRRTSSPTAASPPPRPAAHWRRAHQRRRLRLRSRQPRPHRTRQAPIPRQRPAGPKAPAPRVLRKPPTVVFKLRTLDPSACR